jgi:hypothetical protein
LSPELATALGEWTDRAGKLSAVGLNANVAERWVAAQSQVAQAQASRLIAAMDRVLNDPRVVIDGDPRPIVLDAIRAENLAPEPEPPTLRALPVDGFRG